MSKITVRQVYIMFILATLPPAIRLFPTISSQYGGSAGWLAPIVSAIAALVVIAVLCGLFKSGRFNDLHDVFKASIGGVLTKILLCIYLLWTICLFVIYVRHYAERMTASLFTSVNLDFFIIAMMVIVFFAARANISSLARFSEISILVFAVVLAVFFISLLPTFRLSNVWPVTHYDAMPVLRSSYPIVSVWGLVTLFFFLRIENKDEMKKHGLKTVVLLSVASALMLFLVVGSLGPHITAAIPRPFFQSAKMINIMQSFDRFEAILSSVWVIADFILITAFVFIIASIAKRLFGLKESKYLAGPIVLLGYGGSLLIAANTFELEMFSNSVTAHALNITLCLAIPALVLAVGKMRRKI